MPIDTRIQMSRWSVPKSEVVSCPMANVASAWDNCEVTRKGHHSFAMAMGRGFQGGRGEPPISRWEYLYMNAAPVLETGPPRGEGK
jgi:hypothetical protein